MKPSDKHTDRQIQTHSRQTDTNTQTNTQIDRYKHTDKHTDTNTQQTDRYKHTDRQIQTHRQTDTSTQTDRYKHTDRQTHTHRHTHRQYAHYSQLTVRGNYSALYIMSTDLLLNIVSPLFNKLYIKQVSRQQHYCHLWWCYLVVIYLCV